jgi:hypothetical protein
LPWFRPDDVLSDFSIDLTTRNAELYFVSTLDVQSVFKVGTDVMENEVGVNVKFWYPSTDHLTQYGAVHILTDHPENPSMKLD